MTETRVIALRNLQEIWKRRAAHHDDFRGINTCIRDLEELISKPDVTPPQELQDLHKRTETHLVAMRGRNFQFAGDPTALITELRDALVAFMEVGHVKVEKVPESKPPVTAATATPESRRRTG